MPAPSDSPRSTTVPPWRARRWTNPETGNSFRHAYLVAAAITVCLAAAGCLWLVGNLETLASTRLWVLVVMLVISDRMRISVGGRTFVFNDFVLVIAAFALTVPACAAVVLAYLAIELAGVRGWVARSPAALTALAWSGTMVAAGVGVRGLGAHDWPWVVVAGVAGLALATTMFHLLAVQSMVVNGGVGLRQALGVTAARVRGEWQLTLIDSTVNIALAPVAWVAIVAAPFSLLLLMVPIGLLSWQARRALAVRETERALAQVRERMGLDPLTRLYNRTRFCDLAVERILDALRVGRPVSVVMCDLDHFKQLNDTRGHQAGDEVIVGAANILRDELGDDGIVGRYGGEEFVVLIDGLDPPAAQLKAELVCARIEHDLHGLSMTASLGISHFPGATHADAQASTLLTQLIGDADAALYEAKRSGRNRVCVAGSLIAGAAGQTVAHDDEHGAAA